MQVIPDRETGLLMTVGEPSSFPGSLFYFTMSSFFLDLFCVGLLFHSRVFSTMFSRKPHLFQGTCSILSLAGNASNFALYCLGESKSHLWCVLSRSKLCSALPWLVSVPTLLCTASAGHGSGVHCVMVCVTGHGGSRHGGRRSVTSCMWPPFIAKPAYQDSVQTATLNSLDSFIVSTRRCVEFV